MSISIIFLVKECVFDPYTCNGISILVDSDCATVALTIYILSKFKKHITKSTVSTHWQFTDTQKQIL
jgi:hypothetical protein